METLGFWQLVFAVLVGGVVPAVAAVASVRTSVAHVVRRLDEMSKHIDKAHDRIDNHVVDFHARFKHNEM